MLRFKLIQGDDGFSKTNAFQKNIFEKEMNIQIEKDEEDSVAWHIIGYDGDIEIAAARISKKSEGIFSIDRVCVKKEYRLQYVGDTVLRALEDKAVQLKGYLIEIEAFGEALEFFKKEGYNEDGRKDNSVLMFKDLSKPFKRCNCH